MIETLVVAGISSMLLFGLLKITQVSVKSAQIASTLTAENDLTIAMQTLLSDKDKCDEVFSKLPSSLDKQIFELSDFGEPIKSYFKMQVKALIKVEGIELKKPGDGEENFTFRVFYTKPQLGVFKTLGGLSSKCNPPDNKFSGCYSKDCKVAYNKTETPIKCSLKTCKIFQMSAECGANEYLKGISKTGEKNCKAFCEPGQVLTFKQTEDGSGLKRHCKTVISFDNPDFNSNLPESEEANPKKRDISCPASQILLGFLWNYEEERFEPKCSNPDHLCKGGREYNKEDSRCECPDGTTWDGVACV